MQEDGCYVAGVGTLGIAMVAGDALDRETCEV